MNARRGIRERTTPASERHEIVRQRRLGPVKARGLRLVLAHDARTATCDALARAIAASLADVEIVDASSIDDALHVAATESIDAFLVCLDLPPAPLGGVRLASELLKNGHPIVLVTRSLRWVPPDRPALHDLPWVPPDARAHEITGALAAARGEFDSMVRSRAPSVDDLLEVHRLRARR